MSTAYLSNKYNAQLDNFSLYKYIRSHVLYVSNFYLLLIVIVALRLLKKVQ